MDIESATITARQYCDDRRQIVKLIPIARDVIRKFDGKVYNKRFNTALDKAIEEKHGKNFWFRASLSASGTWLWICAGITGHWSDSVSFCGCPLDDGKRMNAEKMIESCNKHYSDILQEVSAIECNIDRMPEIVEQLSYLHNMQDKIKKSVPRYLDITYRLSDVCKWG